MTQEFPSIFSFMVVHSVFASSMPEKYRDIFAQTYRKLDTERYNIKTKNL